MTISTMTRWATLVGAMVALSGCYTVLQGPRLASAIDDSSLGDRAWEVEDERYYQADSNDPWDSGYEDSAYSDYGSGYPVMGATSGYGLYGFGSPFAYGPGLGSSYSQGYGGRYSPAYGPYGYGYDPYYSDPYYRGGGSNYVPPGYELVTASELASLRTENAVLRGSAVNNVVPTVNRQEALRRKQQQAEQAWAQRAVPETRKSTADYRTTKSAATAPKSTTSATSAEPASSSTKKSGKDAAKRRTKSR